MSRIYRIQVLIDLDFSNGLNRVTFANFERNIFMSTIHVSAWMLKKGLKGQRTQDPGRTTQCCEHRSPTFPTLDISN